MDKTNSHLFEDGTKRTTIATHTSAGGNIAPLNAVSEHAACSDFEAASKTFRGEVDRATRAFALLLSNLCDNGNINEPLLRTQDDESFATISDIVKHGEHLEHFHNYQKQVSVTETTIEWHTDQGLFLVFAPGVLVDQRSEAYGTMADGFYIELPDGSRPMVQFEEKDDLVILLGDGIRQVKADQCGSASLRPLPHALSMPAAADDLISRVWYGRMVLSPASAVHPEHQETGLTFGALRERMIGYGSHDPSIMILGCSGTNSMARQLEETSCEEGTLYCKYIPLL
jgi:hypothetical protein